MNNQLVEDRSGIDIAKLKSGFRRRRKTFWISLFLMAILSVCLVVFVPATYLSKSTILIEQQEIPEELVRSTVTSYADQRIELITQRVMTSKNLWQIIQKYDLYQDTLKREPREVVIEDMREEDIRRNVISAEVVDPRSGRPTETTIAFQLSFEYPDPKLAQKVANEITSLFLSENLKSRTQMAEQASEFLTSESAKLDEKVKSLETELAAFKEKNFDSLPELTTLNLNLLDRTQQALQSNELQIGVVKERINFLESELAQIDPNVPVLSGSGERLLSSKTRLKLAKQQLEQASARYSDNHPDVLRLEKEIKSLLSQIPDEDAPLLKMEIYERQLSSLLDQYSTEHPSVKSLTSRMEKLKPLAEKGNLAASDTNADNPAYIQVKGQLESANIELQGLLDRAKIIKSDLREYEKRITLAPKIEQEYQQLTRDYQSAVIKYAEVKAKQQEATLGESLESEQKGEKFTLIEPPLVPEEAHSPNRKLLAVLGLILTLGVSFGLVILREMLDQSIRSRQDLIRAVGAPPLAVIPTIVTSAQAVKDRNTKIVLLCAAVIGIVTVLSVFHVFIKPLDVTWFIAMRKFGLM